MNTPLTRNEIIVSVVALIVGLSIALATYLAPSHAEETKYRLEHQQPAQTEQPRPIALDKPAAAPSELVGHEINTEKPLRSTHAKHQ